MMSITDRRDELDAMPDSAILRRLFSLNPFGGYSIGQKLGQLTRQEAIDTVLRYEDYSHSEVVTLRNNKP